MSDKADPNALATGEMVEMVGVNVVNTAHEGYRRAGFILHQGENNLPPVTPEVLKALEADPRLAVMVIATDIDSDTSRGLGDQVISTTVTVEDTPVTETIAPVETPAATEAEAAQPETPKKGNGKK
ncbi:MULTISPECIES: HI1506-related protein [Providencia]|nr:HI1506-related protein [Providencia sp. PROV178]MCW4538263.1 HI1506-related protein [Providencia rettgeri]MDX4118108.1 HI1506-related protein [Providencia rettgeri]